MITDTRHGSAVGSKFGVGFILIQVARLILLGTSRGRPGCPPGHDIHDRVKHHQHQRSGGRQTEEHDQDRTREDRHVKHVHTLVRRRYQAVTEADRCRSQEGCCDVQGGSDG